MSIQEIEELHKEVRRRLTVAAEAAQWLRENPENLSQDELQNRTDAWDGVCGREKARLGLLNQILGRCDQLAYYVLGGQKHPAIGSKKDQQLMASCGEVLGGVEVLCIDCANQRTPKIKPGTQFRIDFGFWEEVEKSFSL